MKILLLVLAGLWGDYCNAQDSMDVAYVRTKDDQWQIIDRTGKVLADSLAEHPERAILTNSHGAAVVESGGKYGFRGIVSPWKTAVVYDSVAVGTDGTLLAMTGKGWHIWDPATHSLSPRSLKQDGKAINNYFRSPKPVPACKDNYCLIETDTFINCTGPDGRRLLAHSDVFVAPWNDVNSFINDRILKYKVMANKVCSCHKMTSYYGFIDHNNNWVIQPDYEQADIFSCGVAAVGVGFEEVYTYGYIGMDGEWVIKPEYKEAGRFAKIYKPAGDNK